MPYPVFTAGQILTADDMNHVGLWKVASYSSTAGSGTLACANAFSGSWKMYRIVVSGGSTSATCNIRFAFDSLATGYYSAGTTIGFAAAGVINFNASNIAYWDRIAQGTTTTTSGIVDVYATNDDKWYSGALVSGLATGTAQLAAGWNGSTAAVTGFNLTTSTGTFNAGVTVDVYGYTL